MISLQFNFSQSAIHAKYQDLPITKGITTSQITPNITITSPTNASVFRRGTTVYITWESTDVSSVDIGFRRGLNSWTNIISGVSSTGAYAWSIPTALIPANDYSIQVLDSNTAVADVTDLFMIVGDDDFNNEVSSADPLSVGSISGQLDPLDIHDFYSIALQPEEQISISIDISGLPESSVQLSIEDGVGGSYAVDNTGTNLQVSHTSLVSRTYFIHVYYQNPSSIGGYSGTISISNQDLAPVIFSSSNISYQQGDTGNQISWTLYDANPSNYSIYIDNILSTSQTWTNNETVTFNVDGLPYGVYSIMILVYDSVGKNSSDIVIVTVILIDVTSPSISSPTDIIYEVNSVGNEIIWLLQDDNPKNYSVYLDGELVKSDVWANGDSISYNVDGLTVGEHSIGIWVYDLVDNLSQDNVTILVTEVSLTSNTSGSSSFVSETSSTVDTSSESFNDGTGGSNSSSLPASELPFLLSNMVFVVLLIILTKKRLYS